MGVTASSPDDGAEGPPRVSETAGPTEAQAPTRQLVSAIGGDRCVTCEAPLASDQRYCLTCGERRGRSRFSAAQTTVHAAEAPPKSPDGPREPPRRRIASGTTLVTGIATLLLAMGVGVEIGRISNANNGTAGQARASAPSVQVVTVGSGGGATAATTTPSTSASTKTNSKAAKAALAKSTKSAPVSKKVQTKATQAASAVLGSGAKNLAPATVKQGGACTNGQAGCQNNKFTGNFFGQ